MERIIAWGHENISAMHPTTLEITKEGHLTPRGDCIVAVNANKGLLELNEEFKSMIRNKKAKITCTIRCGNLKETIIGRGDEKLVLTHPTDMVIRKSEYICPRTLMIKANKAAVDLDRGLINRIKNRKSKIIIELEVTVL